MFPMASVTLWSQQCIGRLCNLTQTNIQDTTIILVSKYGNQGVTKSSQSPKTMDPLAIYFTILSWYKFYYEKAPREKVNLTIYCPICEYPMEEIHWFWPKSVESA